MRVNASTVRRTPRRPVELVAICQCESGTEGIKLAATVSTAAGMERREFPCGPTPEGLVFGLRQIALWIDREHCKRAKYRTRKLYDFSAANYIAEVEA